MSLDSYFQISGRGSTVGREIRGGVVTFLTMAYIVVLNPIILLGGADMNGDVLAGGDFAAISAATALAAGVLTILMGVVANFPLALATGLGLNAFVTFSVASQMTWADAMGLVVIEGLIILALVLTGFRQAVFDGGADAAEDRDLGRHRPVPHDHRSGRRRLRAPDRRRTGAGDPRPERVPRGVAGRGVLPRARHRLLAVRPRVRGAILISIVAMTVLAIVVEAVADIGPTFTPEGVNPTGWALNVPSLPDDVVGVPDLQLVGEFNLLGSWENAGDRRRRAAGLHAAARGLLRHARHDDRRRCRGRAARRSGETRPNTQRILVVDSVAAAVGGAASVSSNTSYIESASGVAEGARTGMASVVTGSLFLLTMFFAPVVNVIPSEAAVPALVLVGFLMMQQVKGIDWDDLEIGDPGVPHDRADAVHLLDLGRYRRRLHRLRAAQGGSRQAGDVHPLMWFVAALFVVYFAIDPITGWIT